MNGHQMQMLMKILERIEKKVDKVLLNTTKAETFGEHLDRITDGPKDAIKDAIKVADPKDPNYTANEDDIAKATGIKPEDVNKGDSDASEDGDEDEF